MMRISKKTVRDEDIIDIKEIDKGCWINLVKPTEEEIKFVIEKTGVSEEFVRAALDENERARFDIEKEVLIIFRVPYEIKGNSEKELETLPIGIVVTDDYIITISLSETDILKDFYNKKIKNFYTTKRTRFLIQMLSRTDHYFMRYLNKMEHEIDDTEDRLMESMKNKDLLRLFEIQKTLIYFNRAILANGIVLDNILKGKVVKLYKQDQELLDDIIIENKQSLEMTTTYYNILSNTIDVYSSLLSKTENSIVTRKA
jgi:magnesium transporter